MTDKIKFSQITRQWMDVFMQRSMHGWNHFAKSAGLSMPQFSILMQMHYKSPCGMSEISDRFDISAAAVSQLVDKLVQSGYLERTEDPNDRRAKLLRLSESGTKLVDEGIKERYRWVDELAKLMSAEESKTVGAALEILNEAVRKFEAQPANLPDK